MFIELTRTYRIPLSRSELVRGIVEKHEDGFDYYAFKGIPYAEPPIGELRFKNPLPIKPWTGVLDCKNFGPLCLQYDTCFDISSYAEDCLHLNVYTRSIVNGANRPVIFVIHGDLFMFGSNTDILHGPEHLIRKDVVLVIVNYRLGVLGFLNLEHELAPGNQGLKDQLLALRWVRENVRQFGSDPDNVTALGVSSGAAAAHYLALSPLSKGLFHKVIFQGALLYNPWIIVTNPKSSAVKLCSLLDRDTTDPVEIVQFLRTVDAKRLCEAHARLMVSLDFTSNTSLPWGPSCNSSSSCPVLPIDPQTAASAGVHLPCIIGYNSDEAVVSVIGKLSRADFFRLCDRDFERILLYNGKDVLERYDLDATNIRRAYYGNETISEVNLERYVRLATDLHFAEPLHRFARTQAERGLAATYLFVFSYTTTSSKSIGRMIVRDAPEGCSHFDDLPFIFKMRVFEKLGLPYFEKGTRDYRMMERVTEMWTNFAEYGKPTVDTSVLIPVHWTPVTDGTLLRYLNIDEDMTMQSTINLDRKLLAFKNARA